MMAIVSGSLPAGQSQPAGSSTSIPITSRAPRRSISNAQKPLNVATSRQRLPASDAGMGTWEAIGRVSSQPGVTTPGASSIVWYHWSPATSAASAALAVTVSSTADKLPTGSGAQGRPAGILPAMSIKPSLEAGRRRLAALLGLPQLHGRIHVLERRVESLETQLHESRDEAWERSRERWRAAEPTPNLTWDVS